MYINRPPLYIVTIAVITPCFSVRVWIRIFFIRKKYPPIHRCFVEHQVHLLSLLRFHISGINPRRTWTPCWRGLGPGHWYIALMKRGPQNWPWWMIILCCFRDRPLQDGWQHSSIKPTRAVCSIWYYPAIISRIYITGYILWSCQSPHSRYVVWSFQTFDQCAITWRKRWAIYFLDFIFLSPCHLIEQGDVMVRSSDTDVVVTLLGLMGR